MPGLCFQVTTLSEFPRSPTHRPPAHASGLRLSGHLSASAVVESGGSALLSVTTSFFRQRCKSGFTTGSSPHMSAVIGKLQGFSGVTISLVMKGSAVRIRAFGFSGRGKPCLTRFRVVLEGAKNTSPSVKGSAVESAPMPANGLVPASETCDTSCHQVSLRMHRRVQRGFIPDWCRGGPRPRRTSRAVRQGSGWSPGAAH
jgi:hypothetical protein